MNLLRTFAISIITAAGVLWSDSAIGDSHGQKPAFISVKASQIKWKDAPSVAPGAKIAVIEGDLKAAAPFTFRVKLPPNLEVGVHTHPTAERVTVISGFLRLGIGSKFDLSKAEAFEPGDAFMVPPDTPMYAFTNKETVLQVHGTGPWEMHFHDRANATKKK